MLKSLASAAFGLALTFGYSAAASAHCSNYHQVASYAHELDDAANHFHDVVHDVTGYSHLASDAHELGSAASSFHHNVEFGADCWEIRSQFHEVSHSYQHLARQWRRAHQIHHHPHLHHDWHHVESAFANLQWAVRSGH